MPTTAADPRSDERADERAERADAEHDPDRRRAQPERPAGEQDEDRQQEEVEEVDRARARDAGAQHRVVPEEAEALGELRPDALLTARRRRLRDRRALEHQRREHERERVGDDGERGRERLHEDARGARPGDVGDRAALAETAVRLDVLLAAHEPDEVRGVREIEEHGQAADRERDAEQLPDRQRVEPPRERNRQERGGAEPVGGDHHATPDRTPVDPDSGRKREQQVRQPRERRQHAELRRRRVERDHRDQRDRQRAHLVAEDRDRRCRPEPPERTVAVERHERSESRPRRSSAAAAAVTPGRCECRRSSTSREARPAGRRLRPARLRSRARTSCRRSSS